MLPNLTTGNPHVSQGGHIDNAEWRVQRALKLRGNRKNCFYFRAPPKMDSCLSTQGRFRPDENGDLRISFSSVRLRERFKERALEFASQKDAQTRFSSYAESFARHAGTTKCKYSRDPNSGHSKSRFIRKPDVFEVRNLNRSNHSKTGHLCTISTICLGRLIYKEKII